jgi:CheY-like chemotaxis protein
MKTILIIEDDEAISELLRLAIQLETPHLVLLASNGAEALNIVEQINPSLILIDYLLPAMNGLDLYDRLHALPRLKMTPVILLSATSNLENLLGQRQISVIAKPFDIETLLQTIHNHLGSQ